MSKNIGLLYYKEYFKDLKFNSVSGKATKDSFGNHMLFDMDLNNLLRGFASVFPATHFIDTLSTSYPGLLIGAGYAHEIGGKEIEDELKLGFSSTTLPAYPVFQGSSVKGALRSACETDNGHYIEYIIKELVEGKRKSKVKDISANFIETNREKLIVQPRKKISELVNFVFEGEGVSVYSRDIFFDAFPTASTNENGKFLGNDYITHHESATKNPNPVLFLKVLPKVTFQFNFRLTNECMPAILKLELFKQILLDLGIGAKTNVGYGQFDDGIVATAQQLSGIVDKLVPENIIPTNVIPSLIRNASFQGEVLDQIDLYNIYKFKVGQIECRIKKQSDKNLGLKKGDIVTIVFGADYQKENPNFKVK